MSQQSYDDFVQKLRDDNDLQQELQSRFGNPEQGIPAKDLAAFAAGKGYQFQVEEVQGELSERQLDAVSGGGGDMFIKIGEIKDPKGRALPFKTTIVPR